MSNAEGAATGSVRDSDVEDSEDESAGFGDVRKAILEDDFAALANVVNSSKRLTRSRDAVR